MGMDAKVADELRIIIDAALRGQVSEEQLGRVHDMGRVACIALGLAQSHRILELTTTQAKPKGPHTPSGAVPPYEKPAATDKKRRKKKPGARKGHKGSRRPPVVPQARVAIPPLTTCPCCGHAVEDAAKVRTRIIEDLLENLSTLATEYTIPRHWCPNCKKHVEPGVSAAMPGATIGNRAVALSTVFHYGLGLTIDQVREVLLGTFQTHVSAGSLVDIWRRTADAFSPWYDQIGEEAKASATLHADETGWRVDGQTYWLWCFCNHRCCWYMIDPKRGQDPLTSFFAEAFEGVLIHDFWRPYSAVVLDGEGEHQCCLVHLLREMSHIEAHHLSEKPPQAAEDWSAFHKKVKRLIHDGIHLRRQPDFTPERYRSRIVRIDERLMELARAEYVDADARRLAKRLERHCNEIFTFLDRPEADWNNNFAERQIRPAVVLRRNSQCNRSDRGAATQAVLMTIYRTLKLRGVDPIKAITSALETWSSTGKLPPLPSGAADG